MGLLGGVSLDRAAGRVCLSLLAINIVSRFGTGTVAATLLLPWGRCQHKMGGGVAETSTTWLLVDTVAPGATRRLPEPPLPALPHVNFFSLKAV